MEFKASHFLRSFVLLLLCCVFFASQGKSNAPAYKDNKNSTVSKAFRNDSAPVSPLIKFNLLAGNQEAIRQVHKTSNPVFSAYLLPQTITTCVKCFNFFSGYNDHRYTLRNADFLFPFHAFW
ncbi:MAG: hypothetical protein V4553_17210 [Bacteroidota bacterium]